MDLELKEKLDAIDQQIETEKVIYDKLVNNERYHKTNSVGVLNWSYTTLNREKEIFNNIHKLQLAKQRLITGEKPPEIVYVDRPVETIKYITTREIHINKSSLASLVAWGFLLIWAGLAAAYYLHYFTLTFNSGGCEAT